jgi:hypothetical protein
MAEACAAKSGDLGETCLNEDGVWVAGGTHEP